MTREIVARRDPELSARIVRATPLLYEAGPDAAEERPGFVRAGSSLARFADRIAVIQDDANWVALIDLDSHRAQPVPLPAGHGGHHAFDKQHGGGEWKLDLEACMDIPDEEGGLLVALGSGSGREREKIVVVRSRGDGQADVAVYPVPDWYAALRAEHEFSGSGLNVEGAIYLGDGVIRLFQRGNSEPRDGLRPVDATCEVSWYALWAHMRNPLLSPPPKPSNIVRYDLGELEGQRLTFSDAVPVGRHVLYSASTEAGSSSSADGVVAGSAVGVIGPDREARWTALTGSDGGTFGGKLEGLMVAAEGRSRVYFVDDEDDAEQPSRLYEAELTGPWFPEEGPES